MREQVNILIAAATKLEITPSLAFCKKNRIPVVFTGVGAAPSVYNIVKATLRFNPSIIIQAGIAGCFSRQYRLGEVLAVSQEQFADLGVEENKQWRSLFDLGFVQPNEKPFKGGYLKNPHTKIWKQLNLPAVPGITVNEISTNKARIQLLKAQDAVVESMEGAALHYVALMEKIPFLQVRSLSNYVGERDKSKWNFKDAIGNLNKELVRIIEQMAGSSHV